ncbi:bifunctional 3-deoxy-7-phosphoheptulonate synthase/chorismate mutase type II [Rufibacter latericius]|uniref:chorismate mutase n=1 Tax=Rufibacter latericius TaxID=2487040 RepID=A0A3M9MZW3_9BACT|nr:bifunctional 3-deoxy-7-phosphoheptulonate synthase/chorismate mutase type II [Rufibacter latericius]RNI31102.1 3-deoxy-7-phosphoheptulonate synthase [Rufibacter latericius]
MERKKERNYFHQLSKLHRRPLVIAGPCSAETREQVVDTARQLRAQHVDIFRAGVWKPRSKPGTFEGVGTEGMKWLHEVRQEFGMPVATEVARPHHIEIALKHNIDVLWIGARTTVNPFDVQELAEALRGTHVPIMVKNPVNPDLSLWAGAIERLWAVGVQDVAAIHRGFSSYEVSKYRNVPLWQIPIQLKGMYPWLPVVVDPSHIGGKQELVLPISQTGLDLNFDGVMIETHLDPAQALSDADQQITPSALAEVLAKLQVRSLPDAAFISRTEELRQKIDRADREIIESLARRMRLVEQIGEDKKQNNIAVLQPERWKSIFESRKEWARQMQVNPEFAAELYELIHLESIRVQTEIVEKAEEKKENW